MNKYVIDYGKMCGAFFVAFLARDLFFWKQPDWYEVFGSLYNALFYSWPCYFLFAFFIRAKHSPNWYLLASALWMGFVFWYSKFSAAQISLTAGSTYGYLYLHGVRTALGAVYELLRPETVVLCFAVYLAIRRVVDIKSRKGKDI